MTTVRVGDVEQRWNRNGQAAVASVRLGWRVLPWRLIEGRKVPQIRQWQSGQAFSTEDDVRAWWGVNFTHSPGIVCGPQSMVWVLDVDPRNGGDATLQRLIATYGEIPADTFMVTTPGGGWHYYFEWTAECAGLRTHALRGQPGLDVKADGGWVAAPGGWSDAGRYDLVPGGNAVRPAPAWLLSLAMSDNPAAAEENQDHSETDGTQGVDAWLEGEIARVGATPQGYQRQALLSFTAQLRRRGYVRAVAEWAALEAMSRLSVDPDKGPWSEVDVLAMVAGAWAKYAPVDLSWDPARYSTQPGAELPPPAAGVAEAPAAGVAEEEADTPPPPTPPSPVAAVLGEPPEAIGPDDENARDLKAFAEGRLLWNQSMGWLLWDGRRWVVDEELGRHDVVRELGHQLVRQAEAAGPDGWQEYTRRANRLGTVQGRDACLNYARDLFAISVGKLDQDRMVLNTPAGLVDLRSGSIRPAVPADLVTQMTRVPFVVGARDSTWERVVNSRVPDPADREWLQEWMGYCLTGLDTEKTILAMYGPANTGKSTISEPFASALGSYAIGWSAETIVANSKVNVQEALYRARAARLVTVNEMKVGTRLDEAVIKAATGGDKIIARALYQGSIEYRGQFKLWVHTNHVPDARDDALLQRMSFLGMRQQLGREERDPGVKVWLEESEEAGAAVLWWAWEGLARLLEKGSLGRPPGSDAAVEEHALRSDPVRRFAAEMLTAGAENDIVVWDDLVTAYTIWCGVEQVKPMGPTKLAAALSERGLTRARYRLTDGRRVAGIRGWRLMATTESSWHV